MNILFNNEPDGSISAISFNTEYDGYLHDELYYADINQALGGFMVRWQSNYNNPIHVATIEEAKQEVLNNYRKHTPYSNGNKFLLDNHD